MILQIVKLDESRYKKISLIFLSIIVLLVILFFYDLINDKFFGISLIIMIIGLIITNRINKRIINLGSIRFSDNSIEIKTNNDNLSFNFDSLLRLKLIYKGFEDEFNSGNFIFLNISNGINTIELIDKDNNEYKYEILIKNFKTFQAVKNKFIYLSKMFPHLIEMTKE